MPEFNRFEIRPFSLVMVAAFGLPACGCGKSDPVTKDNFNKVQAGVKTGTPLAEVENILGPGKDLGALGNKNVPSWVWADMPVKLADPRFNKSDALIDLEFAYFVRWGDEQKYIIALVSGGKVIALWQKGIPGAI